MYRKINRLITILFTSLCLFQTSGADAQEVDIPEIAAMDVDQEEIKDAYGFWAGVMFSKPFGTDKKWTAGLLTQYHYLDMTSILPARLSAIRSCLGLPLNMIWTWHRHMADFR